MANLVDMIKNPMKEYKFKNEADNGLKYKYNPSKNRIECKFNDVWFETDYNLSAFIEDELEEVLVYDKTIIDILNNEGKIYKREECDSYYKYVDNSLLYKINDGDWAGRNAEINYFLTLKFAEYNGEV